ncbi:DNA-binding response regulator [Tenacibaculum sp. KUL118]|nr:DNA-binding response regulator [Tenacibaculum sp. KUL118]
MVNQLQVYIFMHLLIIDDHEIVRDGIKTLIEQEYGWHVSYAISALEELPSYASFEEIDVAILDISLANGNGFDTLVKIKQQAPYVKCLMLSMYEHVGYICKALELGADGYVTKNAATKELIDALDSLEKDENYLSSDISRKLAFGDKCLTSILTDREKEIFLLLAKGFQPKQIAYHIDTAPKTVMVHRTNIYRKLEVTSQFGLLRIALETGYLDVSDVINDDVLIKEN